jgi:Fe-S cluster biogenesis protein NfuA
MIYTEITPNPASLKFVTDQFLLKSGSADFASVEQTEDAPIARKLFENFRFVERVFISSNFITITKTPDFQWEEVIPVVKSFLRTYFLSEQPALEGKYLAAPAAAAGDESETVRKIKEILETSVRPAVAGDGGDIIFETFEEGVLKLRLQGSCSGCPSSTITLKQGIERLVTRMIPEVKTVEAV